MSTEIDKRVVEMQFNNKDFEKNAQASLTTIEKLKMALNFDGAKGLESLTKAANKVDLSNISKSADAVAVKFSAMQIAGVTAIQQLTLSFMNFGKTLWNSSFGQIKSGGMARALKIEQANFQMKALAKNIKSTDKEVEKLVEDMGKAIDWSVSGTAYGYDAAASVAAQLMASGLDDAEEMKNHLRAIAGAASMTGRDFENIGNIFTTVASNGKLMTMQLRQFSAAGLNLSATLARSLGTSEEAVNKMVTDGLISFETFSKAIFDEFGAAAGKADETFSGVSKNVKAQLSRIGQKFAEPYIRNMIPFLQDLKQVLRDINDALTPAANLFNTIFKGLIDNGRAALSKFDFKRLSMTFEGILHIATALALVFKSIRKAFIEVFPSKSVEELYEVARWFEEFALQLIPTEKTLEGLKNVLKAPLNILKVFWKLFKAVLSGIEPIVLAIGRFIGSILQLGNAFAPIIDGVTGLLNESNSLTIMFRLVGLSIANIIDLATTLINVLNVIISELLGSSSVTFVIKALNSIADIITRVIVTALYLVYYLISSIISEINVDFIIGVANKVSGFIKSAIDIIINSALFVIALISQVVTGLMEVPEAISHIITYFKLGINDISEFFSKIFKGSEETENSFSKIENVVDKLKDKFGNLFKELTAGKVMMAAFGVGAILLVFSFEKLIRSLTVVTGGLGNLFEIFTDIRKNVRNMIAMKPILDVFIGMSIAIGALTVSLVTLSNDVEPERLKTVAIILGSFVGAILVAMVDITALTKAVPKDSKTMSGVITNLLGFAIGLLSLTITLKMIADMNMDIQTAIKSMAILGVLIVSMTAVYMLLSKNVTRIKTAKDKTDKTFVTSAQGMKGNILSFALSILLLVNALKMITKLDTTNIIRDIIVFSTMMIELAGAIYVLGLATEKGFSIKTSIGISLLGSTLVLIFGLMMILTRIDVGTIEQALGKLLLIISPMLLFILAVTDMIVKSDKKGKSENVEVLKNIVKLMVAFNSVVIAMAILTGVLGSLQPTTLVKGILSVVILTKLAQSVITGFTKLALDSSKSVKGSGIKNFENNIKAIGASMKSFAIMILALSAASIMLEHVSFEGIFNAILIYAAVLGSLWVVMKEAEHTKEGKIGPIIAVTISMITLVGALSLLAFAFGNSNISVVRFLGISFALSAVLFAFAAILSSINSKKFTNSKLYDKIRSTSTNTVMASIALSSMVIAIAGLAYAMRNVSAEQILAVSTMLTVMLVGIAGIFYFFNELSAETTSASRFGKSYNDKRITKNIEVLKQVPILIASISGLILAIAGAASLMSVGSVESNCLNLVMLISSVALILQSLGHFVKAMDSISNIRTSNNPEEAAKVFESLISMIKTLTLSVGGLMIALSASAALLKVSDTGLESLTIFGYFELLLLTIPKSLDMLNSVIAGQNMNEKIANIKGMATTFILMASAISIIASSIAIVSLATSNISESGSGLAKLGIIIVGLLALAATIAASMYKLIQVSENTEKSKLFAISISMVIMSSVLLVIAAAIGSLSAIFSMDEHWVWHLIASVLSLLAVAAIIGVGFYMLQQNAMGMQARQLLALGGSFAIISLSLLSIVGAVIILFKVLSSSTSAHKFELVALSAGAIAGCALAIILGVAALTKRSKDIKLEQAASLAILFATLGVVFLALAASLKILSEVSLDNGIIATFLVVLLEVGLIIAAISKFATDPWSKASVILSAALPIAAIGVVMLAMAASLNSIVNTMRDVPEEKLKQAISFFNTFMILVTALSIVAAAAGTLIGIFGGAVTGSVIAAFVSTIAMTVIAFGVTVNLFAAAVEKLINSIISINNVKIDEHKIYTNIVGGITAAADAFIASAPALVLMFAGLIEMVVAAIVGSVSLVTAAVIALVTGIAQGLIIALPDLLDALTAILAIISEWLNNQDTQDAIRGLAEGIVSILMEVFIGFFDALGIKFNDFINNTKAGVAGVKIDENSSEKVKEVKMQEVGIRNNNKNISDEEVLKQLKKQYLTSEIFTNPAGEIDYSKFIKDDKRLREYETSLGKYSSLVSRVNTKLWGDNGRKKPEDFLTEEELNELNAYKSFYNEINNTNSLDGFYKALEGRENLINDKLESSTEKHAERINKLKESIGFKDLKSPFEADFDKFSKNTDEVTKSVTVLNDTSEDISSSFVDLGKEADSASKKTNKLDNSVIELSGDFEEVSVDLDVLESGMDSTTNSMYKAQEVIAGGGGQLNSATMKIGGLAAGYYKVKENVDLTTEAVEAMSEKTEESLNETTENVNKVNNIISGIGNFGSGMIDAYKNGGIEGMKEYAIDFGGDTASGWITGITSKLGDEDGSLANTLTSFWNGEYSGMETLSYIAGENTAIAYLEGYGHVMTRGEYEKWLQESPLMDEVGMTSEIAFENMRKDRKERWQWLVNEEGKHYKTLGDAENDLYNKYIKETTGFDTYGEFIFNNGKKKFSEATGIDVDDIIPDPSDLTKGLQDLGEEEDEVAKKTDALADSISNALDIFSEFNDTAEMTGHDVLKSFMSQITGVSKWSTELKALAGKGFSQTLLEDLASLGPQGYEKVHALYTMSAKEMSLFNKMYEKKLSLESTTAKDILASFECNAANIAEVYSEELTEQMQQVTPTLMQVVGGGVVSEMAAIPEQAGTAIGEAAFPLTNAFAELGMSSMEAFKKQMDFEEALEAVKVFQAGIINSTTLGSRLFDELGESEEISAKKMLDNMKRQVMNVGEWVSEINTLVARGASEGLVNQLMEMGPEGKAKVDAFVKMTDSELKEANRLYEASAKLPQVSADRITKSYAQAGYNASLGFTEGIDPEAAQNAMYMLAEHSLEYLEAALDINSPSKKTMEIGVYTVEGFIAGIINETSKYKLRNACASITTIIKDSFKNNLSATTFRSIADDCMAGLANGIMASATDTAIKAAEAAKKVTEAVKNAFDTHSPSLIFKWIGQMLMLGLGDGIVEQGDTAAETAALTAKNVIDNVMTKIASMSEYDEQAYTPVIRPVVDMSNVDQGYNDIRSWFDQQGSISMMGNIRLNTNNENGSSDVNRIVDAINNINNQDVVDEIASLRNDISTLQDSMSRLQVVMDTGSLVGQLVQPMDQALGVRAVTNSRGRYS